jgi:hypothetical protein
MDKTESEHIRETMKEKVYELKETDFNRLSSTIIHSIREDLWKLTYLKVITRQERRDIEYFIDKIIYKIEQKNELNTVPFGADNQ